MITLTTLLLAASSAAPQSEAAQHARAGEGADSANPLYLRSDRVLGCEVLRGGDEESADEISDLVVDLRDGTVRAVLLGDGAVTQLDQLDWDPAAEAFRFGADAAQAVEAASQDREALVGTHHVLISKLEGTPLVGEHAPGEDEDEDEIASVGGAFVDVRGGHVDFLGVSVGGFLGLGAETRVVPLGALQAERRGDEEDLVFVSALTEERLETAPKLGDGPQSLVNPAYRDSLYSYYGVDRPAYDRQRGDDLPIFATLESLIGAEIVGPDGERLDTLEDFVVDPATGELTAGLGSSGRLFDPAALDWNWAEEHFRLEEGASSQQGSREGTLLASALAGYEVLVGEERFSSLEGLWIDTRDVALRYATLQLDLDSVRALPWSLARVVESADSDEPTIELAIDSATLKTAPALDGELGASLYDPAFRQRVDALGGAPGTGGRGRESDARDRGAQSGGAKDAAQERGGSRDTSRPGGR